MELIDITNFIFKDRPDLKHKYWNRFKRGFGRDKDILVYFVTTESETDLHEFVSTEFDFKFENRWLHAYIILRDDPCKELLANAKLFKK